MIKFLYICTKGTEIFNSKSSGDDNCSRQELIFVRIFSQSAYQVIKKGHLYSYSSEYQRDFKKCIGVPNPRFPFSPDVSSKENISNCLRLISSRLQPFKT